MTSKFRTFDVSFGGNLSEGQFHTEVAAGITGFQSIFRKENDVEIIFDRVISASEETALDAIIAAHTPVNKIPLNQFFTYSPRKEWTKAFVYEKIGGGFNHAGESDLSDILKIECVARCDTNTSTPTEYSIRIYDKTNNIVVAEKMGLSNTQDEIIDMGTIVNSSSGTILEIHAKKTTGKTNKKVYVEQATIYYNY